MGLARHGDGFYGSILYPRYAENSAFHSPNRPGRRIAGASIYDLACDLVRDGELRARVSAAHGKLDARSGDVVLDDFGVVQLRPVARSVRGARALWRGRDGEIVIPGAYELREGGRVTTGTGLRLRLGGVPRATE